MFLLCFKLKSERLFILLYSFSKSKDIYFSALKDKLKKFGVHVSSSSDSISGMLSVDALLPERSWTDDFPVSTSSAGGTSVSMSNQLPSENESTIEPGMFKVSLKESTSMLKER